MALTRMERHRRAIRVHVSTGQPPRISLPLHPGYACYACQDELPLVRGIVELGEIVATIKNFGFMWERDKVNWGKRGPGGTATFEGIMVRNLKRRVSFLDQMGIYVLYDKFEHPVQIGQSKNIFGRLRQHRKDHLRNRWALFSWFGFFKVGANDVLVRTNAGAQLRRQLTLGDSLNELEAILIQVLEPRLNRRGPNWQDTEEYLQDHMEIDEEDESDSSEAA